ncbi:MAG: HEPN domain-containing protein [Patescibacteria group bacterium]|jgi:HEPN domain-containing protein
MKSDRKDKEKLFPEWFRKAEEDELSARDILNDQEGAPSTVCFLSQQIAEKCLKGYLVYKKNEFPRIHLLDKLINLCREIDRSFDDIMKEAKFLSDFYVATRYPGDFPDFDFKDAEKAFEAALKIKNFVLKRIK